MKETDKTNEELVENLTKLANDLKNSKVELDNELKQLLELFKSNYKSVPSKSDSDK